MWPGSQKRSCCTQRFRRIFFPLLVKWQIPIVKMWGLISEAYILGLVIRCLRKDKKIRCYTSATIFLTCKTWSTWGSRETSVLTLLLLWGSEKSLCLALSYLLQPSSAQMLGPFVSVCSCWGSGKCVYGQYWSLDPCLCLDVGEVSASTVKRQHS